MIKIVNEGYVHSKATHDTFFKSEWNNSNTLTENPKLYLDGLLQDSNGKH